LSESDPADDGQPEIIAYEIDTPRRPALQAAPAQRGWMDASPRRFAYRCLPMLIANQSGWHLLCPHRLVATWSGGAGADAIMIDSDGTEGGIASSHFGNGVLTFHAGYLFRTPPGWNLHVRGPANLPKDAISALEGVVETDWTEAPFTINWQITRPAQPILFEAGEPIALIAPVRRGELERFHASVRPLAADADLAERYAAWAAARGRFNAELQQPGSEAVRQGWQKRYTQGRDVHGQPAGQHQTALSLRDFQRSRHLRHCEERSDEAIQSSVPRSAP